VHDQRQADGMQLFFVHGFYQAWRSRTRDDSAALPGPNSVRSS
jgi:hypothetical protein